MELGSYGVTKRIENDNNSEKIRDICEGIHLFIEFYRPVNLRVINTGRREFPRRGNRDLNLQSDALCMT